MSSIKVDWSAQSTTDTLRPYDRFTRHDVINDFERDAVSKAVPVDPEKNIFATAVFDNRYMVIWQQQEDSIRTMFVTACQYRGEKPARLKEKLDAVVRAQTHNRYSLASS